MATIEERAHSAYCGRTTCTPENKIQHFCVNCLHDGRKKAYIKGATVQRELDIKEFIQWLKRSGDFIKDRDEEDYVRKELENLLQ